MKVWMEFKIPDSWNVVISNKSQYILVLNEKYQAIKPTKQVSQVFNAHVIKKRKYDLIKRK